METFWQSAWQVDARPAGLNKDLKDIAAMLSPFDECVGGSNANMHIRAGLNKAAHAGERPSWQGVLNSL